MSANPEAARLAALQAGDAAAFEALVAEQHAGLLRLARLFLTDERLAEEAVQETWLAAVRGLERFEGRSSLKTWLVSILMNRARTIGKREARYLTIDFESEDFDDGPTVEPTRFYGREEEWDGYWREYPAAWPNQPEAEALSGELLALIEASIRRLPARQRAVILLRDMQHWGAEEVCNALDVSETNQRVLLHRARAAVRQALESYFEEQP